MSDKDETVNAGDAPADDQRPDQATDLNELMELEILREVDADGNPVEPEEDPDSSNGDVETMAEEGAELELVEDDPQAAAEEERDRLREDLLRAQADFINFRKRMEKEKREVVRRASQALIEELLPVIDNFELAMANDPEQVDPGTYREGVRLIHKQLVDLLNRQGLEEIQCMGETFDPNIHEAVAVINDPDQENNTIVAQLKKGYTLRDRLIRSPMVQVVIHDDNSAGNGDDQGDTDSTESSTD